MPPERPSISRRLYRLLLGLPIALAAATAVVIVVVCAGAIVPAVLCGRTNPIDALRAE